MSAFPNSGGVDYNLEEGEIRGETIGNEHKKSCKVDSEEVEQRKLGNPTIFFVTNIPDGCSKGRLMEAFNKFGDIFDIYIAKKKDKSGRNFGFVKFRNVVDGLALEAKIKNISVDNNTLVVYRAKFDRSGNKLETPSFCNQYMQVQEGFVKSNPAPFFQTTQLPGGSNKSYLGALLNRNPTTEKSIILSPDTVAFSDRQNSSLVGRVIDFKSLCTINSLIAETNFSGVELRYLGGFHILLSFSDSNDAQCFLRSYDTWNKWFSSLNCWVGQSFSYERIAWVRILGVPAHLWDRSVLDSIGNHVGKVIQGSQISWEDRNWSQECIGVLVGDGQQIREDFNLKWRDKNYHIWIIEEPGEWIPDFLNKIMPHIPSSAIELIRPAFASPQEKLCGEDQSGVEKMEAGADNQHPSGDKPEYSGVNTNSPNDDVRRNQSLLGSEKLINVFDDAYGQLNALGREKIETSFSNDISHGEVCINLGENSKANTLSNLCPVLKEKEMENGTATPSQKLGPFFFNAGTTKEKKLARSSVGPSNSKRDRPKSSSPVIGSSPTNPLNLSFIRQTKKRSRIDPDPFHFDELLGLNCLHNPIPPDPNSPTTVDLPVPKSNSQLIVKPVEGPSVQANIFSKVGSNIGSRAAIKSGESLIGKSKNIKGARNPIQRQKRGVKLKCVKIGGVTTPAPPKPELMFPPSYPP